MVYDLPFSIDEVVDLLGLERNPKEERGLSKYHVRCPFCGDGSRKYHMAIDTQKNVYTCYKCGGGEKGTGTLDLYAKVRMGTRHIKGTSGNGKEIIAAILKDLGREPLPAEQGQSKWKANAASMKPSRPEISAASDARLNKAYSFLIQYPAFHLSEKHRANLLKRGLDDTAIAQNGYATVPATTAWTSGYTTEWAVYKEKGLEAAKNKQERLKNAKNGEIVAGLILASDMLKAGINLNGVPGAFTLTGTDGKEYWCFIYTPGILIPTRNEKGQIVALQTRLDKGSLRYMTLSSSGLPNAVASGISRTHFPLGNSSPKEATEILCTEGPLKADVIVHLYGAPVYVMALHGVSNTKELNRIFRQLKLDGIVSIGNAFDMDKLANTNVRKQSRALMDKARSSGLSMYQKCWDLDYAKVKCEELRDLCYRHQVSYPAANNIFSQIALMADALKEANIPFCVKTVNGEDEHDYWRDETKGMDDFLLWSKNH